MLPISQFENKVKWFSNTIYILFQTYVDMSNYYSAFPLGMYTVKIPYIPKMLPIISLLVCLSVFEGDVSVIDSFSFSLFIQF